MNAALRAALRRLDRQFDAIRAMPTPIPPRERHRHGIEEAGVGTYLRLAGQVHRVESVSAYREKGASRHELELLGLETGTTSWLEWERGDPLEVIVSGAEISLSQLGVSADRVEEMSEAESGSIRFEGRTFHYDDDHGAEYFRDGQAAPEPVYFYDFETKDERFRLCVEEWGSAATGYRYSVFVSEQVEPDSVEVVALGASGGS